MTDITMAVGGDDSTGAVVKSQYIDKLGLDPRMGSKNYLQVTLFETFGGTSQYWPSFTRQILANMGGLLAQGRATATTFDPAAQAPTQWALNPSEAVSLYAPFMVPYWQSIVNGSRDSEWHAAAQAIKDGKINDRRVSFVFNHEGSAGFWYPWSGCVHPSLYVGSMAHIMKIMRDDGIVCRFSIDFGGNAGFDFNSAMTPELLGLIDAVSTDPYRSHSQVYPPPVDIMMQAIAWAEAHGKLVELPEVGGLGGCTDDEMLPYCQNLLAVARAHPCVASVTLFTVQPESTTYNPDGSVQYYGSGACDFLGQSPRPYPKTFAYMKGTGIPGLLAVNPTTPPVVTPPPSGGGTTVSYTITFPDAVQTPGQADIHNGTITNSDGHVRVKIAGTGFTKLDLWGQGTGKVGATIYPNGTPAAQLIPTTPGAPAVALDANGEATVVLAAAPWWPLGNGPTYSFFQPLNVVATGVTQDPRDAQIVALQGQVAQLSSDKAALTNQLQLASSQVSGLQAQVAAGLVEARDVEAVLDNDPATKPHGT